MANIKLKFVPNYATANTVRFDEIVPEGDDFLNESEPVFGQLYFQKEKLRNLGWKGTVGPEYEAPGANGRTFKRRDVTSGEAFTITLTKGE